jgi:hypothetical protein
MASLHLIHFLCYNLLLRYNRVSRSRGNLFPFLNHIGVLDLFGKQQVQDHRNECSDGKARFHDQFNGIKKPAERVVVTGVGEDVRKPVWHEGGAVAEGQGRGEDEASATVELHTVDDRHAGNGDGTEEKGGHAAEDTGGDRDKSGGEFGEEPGCDEED